MPRTPHQRKMERIRRKARNWVRNFVGLEYWLEVQDHKCGRCGRALDVADASIDHVWPLWAGGINLGNLLLAHEKCNQRKDNKPPNEREIEMLQHVNNVLGYCGALDIYWYGYEKQTRLPPLKVRHKIHLALIKLIPYATIL